VDEAADDRVPGTGGGLPVDVADVVARVVLDHVVEVLPVPGEDRAVVPVEQAGGTPDRGKVQARADLRQAGGARHPQAYGAGTAAKSASMGASGETLFARAS